MEGGALWARFKQSKGMAYEMKGSAIWLRAGLALRISLATCLDLLHASPPVPVHCLLKVWTGRRRGCR